MIIRQNSAPPMHTDRFSTALAERRAVFDTLPAPQAAVERIGERPAGVLRAAGKPVERQVRALGLA